MLNLAFYGTVFFAPSLFFLDYDTLFTSDEARNRLTPLGRAGAIDVVAIGDEAHRRCRMILLPQGTYPHVNKRTFLAIEHAPLAKTADRQVEVFFFPGSTPAETQRPLLTIDGIEFRFFAGGNGAHARDAAAAHAIVAALERGQQATIGTRLENGTDLSISLGLQGMGKAMEMMVAACGAFMPRDMPRPTRGVPTPPVAIGTFGDFKAFSRHTGVGRICYLVVRPRGGNGAESPASLVVTNDPVRGLYGEILVFPGQPVSPDARLRLSLRAEGRSIKQDLFMEGDHAWPFPHVEEMMDGAMRDDRPLNIDIPSLSIRHSYSTKGYAQARRAIDDCR